MARKTKRKKPRKKKSHKKRNAVYGLFIALAMIQVAWYILPFGYDVSFYALQNTLFGGDYWTTTLFFYILTGALFVGAIIILAYYGITWAKIHRSIKKAAK